MLNEQWLEAWSRSIITFFRVDFHWKGKNILIIHNNHRITERMDAQMDRKNGRTNGWLTNAWLYCFGRKLALGTRDGA